MYIIMLFEKGLGVLLAELVVICGDIKMSFNYKTGLAVY